MNSRLQLSLVVHTRGLQYVSGTLPGQGGAKRGQSLYADALWMRWVDISLLNEASP